MFDAFISKEERIGIYADFSFSTYRYILSLNVTKS